MNLRERMIAYRSKHNLSRRQLAILLSESKATLDRLETGKHKPHEYNEWRLHLKLKELEDKESVCGG